MIDIREIVEEYLIANGYDGLYQEDECACEIGDLMPCDMPMPDCRAGYKTVCKEGTPHKWMISEELMDDCYEDEED